MVRSKNKVEPTLEEFFFSSPAQKVIRLLLAEPTTVFTPRAISSKLKGVRGLGGLEGILAVLNELQVLGLVDFVDNHRSVRLRDEHSFAHLLKVFVSICDLGGFIKSLEPVSQKGILFGSRAAGKARTDSNYNVLVIAENTDEVLQISQKHPLGKLLETIVWTSEKYADIEKDDLGFSEKLKQGWVLWGPNW